VGGKEKRGRNVGGKREEKGDGRGKGRRREKKGNERKRRRGGEELCAVVIFL